MKVSVCISGLLYTEILPHEHSSFSSLVRIFVLKSILSNIRMAIPALFWLLFVWYVLSHPFTFNICVSLNLKCVSYRQHIVWTFFFFL